MSRQLGGYPTPCTTAPSSDQPNAAIAPSGFPPDAAMVASGFPPDAAMVVSGGKLDATVAASGGKPDATMVVSGFLRDVTTVQDDGDGVDYSYRFRGSNTFDTFEQALIFARHIAYDIGFSLIVYRYNGKNINTVTCDRFGSYKCTSRARKNTSSKKCGCQFQITIKLGKRGQWGIIPKYGFHNHRFVVYKEGHRQWAKLTDAQKQYIRELKQSHVKPEKIRLALKNKFPELIQPNIKQIYNILYALGYVDQEDRNRAQQMILLAKKNEYVYYFEKDSKNAITHVFMAHPESVKMLKARPYICVMDATYKTNQYGMPLVEIIGVTPVGKSFLIGYAFVENEQEPAYIWVLEKLKSLFMDGVSPYAIVTDREQSLIAALKVVFPNTPRLLCIFHIYNKVEAKALFYFKGRPDKAFVFTFTHFRALVEALTEDEFIANWDYIMAEYTEEKPKLVKYIYKYWISKYKESWAKCWTNKITHFGNTATSRAESAHAVLKGWVRTSIGGLDSIWSKAHNMMEGQHSSIRSCLEQSFSRFLGDSDRFGHIFSLLNGKVSKRAILLMREEYIRGEQLGLQLVDKCGCALRVTQGLICACDLLTRSRERRKVHMDEIHKLWSTYTYTPPNLNEEAPNDDLESAFDNIRKCSRTLQRRILDVVNALLHPEEDDIREPNVVEARRGRPRNSTTRNLSGVEHARRINLGKKVQPMPLSSQTATKFDSVDHEKHRDPKVQTTPSSCQSFTEFDESFDEPQHPFSQVQETALSTQTSNEFDSPGAPLEYDLTKCVVNYFPYNAYLPTFLLPFFEAYFDPQGDGNCGFRCISSASTGGEEEYTQVRAMLLNLITSDDVYKNNIYIVRGIQSDTKRINWPHQRGCGIAHWMRSEDFYGFATIYNWAICCCSHWIDTNGNRRWDGGSLTYLPLKADTSVTAPYGILWILHTGAHYLRIKVKHNSPMPPIDCRWYNARDESLVNWDTIYVSHLQSWPTYNFVGRNNARDESVENLD